MITFLFWVSSSLFGILAIIAVWVLIMSFTANGIMKLSKLLGIRSPSTELFNIVDEEQDGSNVPGDNSSPAD